MLCIDYTLEVACEAAGQNCQLVIAYNPPIFKPLKNVLAGGVVFDAIRRGVAIYSPHTALDVADGGTNDVLADVLKLVDRRPLKPSSPAAREYKLVTFVPADAVENVSQAQAEQMARRLAAEEGLFCGISAAGACEVALRVAHTVENATIVFVVCDRGDRYLSTGVFPA